MKIPFVEKFVRPSQVEEATVTDRSSFLMEDKMLKIITQLRVQAERLNRTSQRLTGRGRELFDQCVRAETEKDSARAYIYANEISQLRKMSRTVLRSQMSLEKVILRLETVREFGDVLNVLGPASSIIRQVQGELSGVVPEVANSLVQVDEMLDGLIVEAGNVTGATVDVMVRDEEAQKILQEASEIAAQRMKTSFPDLPEAYKHLETSADISKN